MFPVSRYHSPASHLMEEFGQKPKMQRSLGLAVSLMSNHVFWKATGPPHDYSQQAGSPGESPGDAVSALSCRNIAHISAPEDGTWL